jgi:beta-phosphoglucomutase-like phosphatase (HAD superfamily)
VGERQIEAVVFDMDGVLIDSEPTWRAVEREVATNVGVELSDEDLERTMGVRIPEVVDTWYASRPWTGPSRDEVVTTVLEGVAAAIERDGELNEGALGAVRYVKNLGLRVALASSSPMRLIRAVLTRGGLFDSFDVVRSAESEDRGKPDPAVYLSTARALGVEASRCLAVEDSESGVRSAKAAGMVCVAVASLSPRSRLVEADLVLGSLAEFDERIWSETGTVPAPPVAHP